MGGEGGARVWKVETPEKTHLRPILNIPYTPNFNSPAQFGIGNNEELPFFKLKKMVPSTSYLPPPSDWDRRLDFCTQIIPLIHYQLIKKKLTFFCSFRITALPSPYFGETASGLEVISSIRISQAKFERPSSVSSRVNNFNLRERKHRSLTCPKTLLMVL